LQYKSQVYFYPCRFQQSVSKTSPLLCPISLPNRVATSELREYSHTLPLCLLRGEGTEGRRLQAAPRQGDAQQGRGFLAVLTLSSFNTRWQEKRGHPSIPKVEAHTEQRPDNKAYLGGTPRPCLSRQTVIFMVTCLLVGN
jgi:hypothetical protein